MKGRPYEHSRSAPCSNTCASGFWNLELSEPRFLLLRDARLVREPRKLREPLRRDWLEEPRPPLLPERLEDSSLLLGKRRRCTRTKHC